VGSLASRFTQSLPSGLAALKLPVCANPACFRPPTLWQRWWARDEGIEFEQEWYCSGECFTAGLLRRVEALCRPLFDQRVSRPRFPLGLILLEQGIVSTEQLQAGLACQRRAGEGRIGEWLVRHGVATASDIMAALAVQQNCPVFAPASPPNFPAAMQFPAMLMRNYGGVPVYFSAVGKTLYLGFVDPLNRRLLRAAGQLMRCRIEPCMVSEDLHRSAAARWEAGLRGEAILIEQRQSTREMVRAIAGYAEQALASSCAMVRCEDYLWTRLYGDLRSLDLLFRLRPNPALAPESDQLSGLRFD
jgi:hypothetical protein